MTWFRPEDFDSDVEFDFRELRCPRCGAADVTVLDLPKLGSWMKRTGKARCNHCALEFRLYADPPDDNVVAPQPGSNFSRR